jgi:hypothetical protein
MLAILRDSVAILAQFGSRKTAPRQTKEAICKIVS